MNTLFSILAGIGAVVAFVIAWLVSEFFIPPRDHWSKSGFTILLVKLGMAFTAAFYTYGFIYVFFKH
jgi:hypothetical protein